MLSFCLLYDVVACYRLTNEPDYAGPNATVAQANSGLSRSLTLVQRSTKASLRIPLLRRRALRPTTNPHSVHIPTYMKIEALDALANETMRPQALEAAATHNPDEDTPQATKAPVEVNGRNH